MDELDVHLRLFVDTFLSSEERDRWHYLFVEMRDKWYGSGSKLCEKARRLIGDFEGRKEYVRFLTGPEAFPLSLAARFGEGLCVCVDLHGAPYKLPMAAAVSKATQEFRDMIISCDAGKSAVVIDHEGGVRLCWKA